MSSEAIAATVIVSSKRPQQPQPSASTASPSSTPKRSVSEEPEIRVGGNGMFVEEFPISIATNPPPPAEEQHIYAYTGMVHRSNDGRVTQFVPSGKGTMTLSVYRRPNGDQQELTNTTAAVPTGAGDSIVEARGEKLVEIRFEGMFVCGKRHGFGTLANIINGKKTFAISCDWADDVPDLGHRPGRFEEAGNVYLGMLSLASEGSSKDEYSGLSWARRVRFMPDACGEMVYSTRERYCGEWQCGQRHGFGVEIDSMGTTTFMGGFQFDAKEGAGTVFNNSTGTVLSGHWKEGEVDGAAGLHLKHRLHTIQGVDWAGNAAAFEEGTLVRRRQINGVWEPLFLAFDDNLANWCAELFTVIAEQGNMEDAPTEKGGAMVLEMIKGVLQKPELAAIYAVFQRCMFFLYGSCGCRSERGGGGARDGVAKQQPRSWCCMANVSTLCLHRMRGKSVTEDVARSAINDTASFVFSVRLRLLSVVAALPHACDYNLGRPLLALVWESVYGVVGPVLEDLSAIVHKDVNAALHLSTSRCSKATLADFVDREAEQFKESLDVAHVELAKAMQDAIQHNSALHTISTSSGPVFAATATIAEATSLTDRMKVVMKTTVRMSQAMNMESGDPAGIPLQADDRHVFEQVHTAIAHTVAKGNGCSRHVFSDMQVLHDLFTLVDPRFPAPPLGEVQYCQNDTEALDAMSSAHVEERTADDGHASTSLRRYLLAIRAAASCYPAIREVVHSGNQVFWPLQSMLLECRHLLLHQLLTTCDAQNPPSGHSLDTSPAALPYEFDGSFSGQAAATFGRGFLDEHLAELSCAAQTAIDMEDVDPFLLWVLDAVGVFLHDIAVPQSRNSILSPAVSPNSLEPKRSSMRLSPRTKPSADPFIFQEREFVNRSVRATELMDRDKIVEQLTAVCIFLERLGIECDLEPNIIEPEKLGRENTAIPSGTNTPRRQDTEGTDEASPITNGSFGGVDDSLSMTLRRRDKLSLDHPIPPMACKELAAQWSYAVHTIRHYQTTHLKRAASPKK